VLAQCSALSRSRRGGHAGVPDRILFVSRGLLDGLLGAFVRRRVAVVDSVVVGSGK